ncbi:MAG: DNA recombination protein RmuC [Actinomycetota bacterium]|nr:DNA recombination protein RmuC [Actinomycetota bacterium]MEC9426866.1 DNA recombination protein RmuC [Actinomycetota bacterium]
METALVLVAVFSVLVAVVTAVWAVRRPASVPGVDPMDASPPVDPAALAQMVGAEVKARMAEAASTALAKNNEQFLALATERMGAVQEQTKGLLGPFAEQMKKLDDTVGKLRTAHEQDKGAVATMTEQLGLRVAALQAETTTLSEALRSRSARGVWGENQLRNVIELSGMEPYCDFTEQTSAENREGAGVRPDVKVRLPNGAHLFVDAKVPLDAYLRAQEATEQQVVDAELRAHAKALKEHVKDLARKKYWEADDQPSPEFVVLFVPGESFLADALRVEPSLLQDAMNQRVLLASPVNLLALLWAVAGGWQQARVNQHARDVAELGAELYDRVGTVLGKVEGTGRGLNTAVKAFNGLVASFEGRLLPTMRKFPDLGVGSDELPSPTAVDEVPRSVVAPESPVGDLPSGDPNSEESDARP